MSSRYLNKGGIEKLLGVIVIDPTFSTMSQDSYNEKAVLQTIAGTGRHADLLYAAINMSVIGYGNKRFGNYRLNDKIVDILQILIECGVKTGLGRDAKLGEGDLTPGRLCRALRTYIRAYLESTGLETYLFRKYSDKDLRYNSILFRGAEYLEDLSKEESDQILLAHERLDLAKGTNISERVIRVFAAKGAAKRTIA
jgi:hypothetical protein